jgi:DUF4097 and DUF4098 domain-containing protein YvlB
MFKVQAGLLVVFIALLVVPFGCSAVMTSEEFLQTYQVRSGTVVEVYNRNGSITLTGWDEDSIEIRAVKESVSGQEALDQVDINIDIADKLIIETVFNDSVDHVSVNYEIKVPVDLLVGLVQTANGSITIENVGGNPELSTSNGSITAINVNGIVSASSSNGNITVNGARSLASLTTSNGNIAAELRTLYDHLEVSTSNGSISMALAPSLTVDLTARTSNGSITVNNLNFDVTTLDQSQMIGTLNGGGFNLSLVTSNGSIELAPLR